jgi:TPR repeat protein
MELAIVKNDYLTDVEKIEIDRQIDGLIEKHRGNSLQINRLVFDSVTALETSNSYTEELESQGTVKIFFGMMSGKNKNLQSEIDKNLYKSQYSSQQTLQKLAEQNLMSFELITAVNNKLNTSIIDIENEINTIYGTLVTFFKQIKRNLIQIGNRLDKLERNVNILNWVNTIEYQMFNGVEYGDLNKIEKIVCLATDFYSITKGDWTTSDLLLLKSAISEIGLSPKENIKYEEVIKYIAENEALYNKLIDEDVRELDSKKYLDASIISGVSKCKLLESSEEYILNTVLSQLENSGISTESNKIKYSLVKNYIGQTNYIDIAKEVNLFNFVIELLLNISIFNYTVSEKYICVDIDFEELDIELVKKYAEKNNVSAQSYLGRFYFDEDYKESYTWCLKAAQQGDADSQFILSILYMQGEGIEKNYEEGFKWCSKASEQGEANSQYLMGGLYREDNDKIIVVSKDNKEAIRWYKKSAENRCEEAQDELGDIYYNGELVEKDYKEAIRWYRKAAEQGNKNSQFRLGYIYKNGLGIEKDYKEAFKWYKKAADQGHNSAKEFLRDKF